ncbi:RlmE family RNA methyltransferase [Patescibacteria group bacterium]|nr:RlmE family RNA methyltransferase [Patescibacteria group bacterium]MCL5409708.1 RlmE family RNA methyltransferase [Patescibacteria group bacterium]
MSNYNPHDKLFQQARHAGFRARSVFKLAELDQKFALLKGAYQVLDLGAAPGSWSQYLSQKLVPQGKIISIDLQTIKPIAQNVIAIQADITDHTTLQQILQSHGWEIVDLIVSDLSPKTSGIKYADNLKSVELNQAVVNLAQQYLKPTGKLVMKVFPGTSLDGFIKQLKSVFRQVHVARTQASRASSKEVYLVCQK